MNLHYRFDHYGPSLILIGRHLAHKLLCGLDVTLTIALEIKQPLVAFHILPAAFGVTVLQSVRVILQEIPIEQDVVALPQE